jgi:hypothetical protein
MDNTHTLDVGDLLTIAYLANDGLSLDDPSEEVEQRDSPGKKPAATKPVGLFAKTEKISELNEDDKRLVDVIANLAENMNLSGRDEDQ